MAGIPSRLAEIKRDLGPIAAALATKGGGGSASELRSDAGIFFGIGVEETLKRDVDLLTTETIVQTVSPGAGATVSATFSFATDHYILGIAVVGTSGVAAFEWGALLARRFPATNEQLIYWAADTDMVNLAAGSLVMSGLVIASIVSPTLITPLPLFGVAETDYEAQFRGKAGAGGTFHVIVQVARCPKGVEIPH